MNIDQESFEAFRKEILSGLFAIDKRYDSLERNLARLKSQLILLEAKVNCSTTTIYDKYDQIDNLSFSKIFYCFLLSCVLFYFSSLSSKMQSEFECVK